MKQGMRNMQGMPDDNQVGGQSQGERAYAKRELGCPWAGAFQNAGDRVLLQKIEAWPIFPKIVGWAVDREREELEAARAGDAIAVTHKSMPSQAELFEQACHALNWNSTETHFFVYYDPHLNAFTTGSKEPVVMATSALVDELSPEELLFVLGHELGHYLCGHCRCQTLARYAMGATAFAAEASLGIAGLGIISRPLLLGWSRQAEFSADRAGLLACQNFEAASAVYMKLAGAPKDMNRADTPSDILRSLSSVYVQKRRNAGVLLRLKEEIHRSFTATHPRVIERFMDLDEWHEMGMYALLKEATLAERTDIANAVRDDPLWGECLLAVTSSLASYFSQGGLPEQEARLLLLKAILLGQSLQGTELGHALQIKLSVEEIDGENLSYAASVLLMSTGATMCKRIVLDIHYPRSRDSAPKGVRDRLTRERCQKIEALLYSVQ